MKTCKTCGEEKPIEEFVKSKNTKDGRLNKCKLCDNLIRKEQYYANHEYRKQKDKEYREKNKEKLNLCKRRYKEKNREKLRLAEKEWRKNNPELSRERSRRYREAHPNYKKEYYAKNKSKLIKKVIKWQKENKERYIKRVKEWKMKNYNAWLQNERERHKTKVENLTDDYVVKLLKGKGKLLVKDVPKELIEAKRLQILIQREIKNLNKGEVV
jgi:hypothetical protein